jgi:hypothetical protein
VPDSTIFLAAVAAAGAGFFVVLVGVILALSRWSREHEQHVPQGYHVGA